MPIWSWTANERIWSLATPKAMIQTHDHVGDFKEW
jgi:hypothetical protein